MILRHSVVSEMMNRRSTPQVLKCASTCIPDKEQAAECDFYLWEGVLTNNKIAESDSHTVTDSSGLEESSPLGKERCYSPGKTSALRSRKHPHLSSNLLLRLESRRRSLGYTNPFLLHISAI